MKTKIFFDDIFYSKDAPPATIIYPFLGTSLDQANGKVWETTVTQPSLKNFISIANKLFELSAIEDSDFIVLPNDLSFLNDEVKLKAFKLISLAKQKTINKPVVGFFSGDRSHLSLPLELDAVFRDSLYETIRKINDFAMPIWIDDLTKSYGDNKLVIREKKHKPSVGFCGYIAPNNLKTYSKALLYRSRQILPHANRQIPPHHTGHVIRKLAIETLQRSLLVETNFVLRSQAGLIGNNVSQAKAYRKVFVQNLQESDYIFCCRGSGNHSNRLYETLCYGRIPVFLNTDCVLPFDFDIDWKKYLVFVEEKDISRIDKIIYDFHSSLSPSDFVDFQMKCRNLWLERLSPEGFFTHFHRHFDFLKRQYSWQ